MIELKFPPTAPFIAAAVSYLQALTPVESCSGGRKVPLAGFFEAAPGVTVSRAHDEVTYTLPPGAQVGAVAQVGSTDPAVFMANVQAPLPTVGFGVNPPAGSAFSSDDDEEEQPTTNNVHPQFDGRGFPWDARIHSSSKALLAKPPHGWKPLRGVDKALVAQVEAELTQSGRTQAATPGTQPGVIPPPPVVPQAAPPPPPAAPTVGAPPANFAELMSRLGNANKVVEAQAMLPALGVEAFPQLINHPDKWAQLAAMVGV